MKLNTFLHDHQQKILEKWLSFARTLPPAADLSDAAVNDHAAGILRVISQTMENSKSREYQPLQSEGQVSPWFAPQTAASIHGAERQTQGFSLLQVIDEYGVLRACVLRLWLPTVPGLSASIIDEMVRFNEAIDEAILQSVLAYSRLSDGACEIVPASIN
jgi:hypothetical protein